VPQQGSRNTNTASARAFALLLASLALTTCQPRAVLTPPANAAYYPGQSLTFRIGFPAPVTVTGKPRLVLSALGAGSFTTGNHAYAVYAGGSGTSALTFTYTVRAGDGAQSGIAVASAIDLAGGTISPPAPSFSPPDLSHVGIAPFPWPVWFR